MKTHLLERALDFGGRHAAFLDGRVEVASRTILHHLTPVLVLVLDQVDRFNDVRVSECRGDTELGGELLDVLPLALVLAAFPELLRNQNINSGGFESLLAWLAPLQHTTSPPCDPTCARAGRRTSPPFQSPHVRRHRTFCLDSSRILPLRWTVHGISVCCSLRAGDSPDTHPRHG